MNLDNDLGNDLLRRNYCHCFYAKTASGEEQRQHSGDAVQNQSSGCDKYSVKERNWGNIIA